MGHGAATHAWNSERLKVDLNGRVTLRIAWAVPKRLPRLQQVSLADRPAPLAAVAYVRIAERGCTEM